MQLIDHLHVFLRALLFKCKYLLLIFHLQFCAFLLLWHAAFAEVVPQIDLVYPRW